jgi:hypothetical protein
MHCVDLRQLALAAIIVLTATPATAALVAVDQLEGMTRAVLNLKSAEGELLANGEATQVAKGDKVTDRLVFRFKDGSLYEDTAEFSQKDVFRFISDHSLQRGPSFKRQIETSIDASGQVVTKYIDKGEEKTLTRTVALPEDVSNGMLLMLLGHIPESITETEVSYVASDPEPRLVHMVISREGDQQLRHGTMTAKAVPYVIRVKIGGIRGMIAPIIGKQPPETKVWVFGAPAPAFIRFEGPLSADGPVWRIDLAAPGEITQTSRGSDR